MRYSGLRTAGRIAVCGRLASWLGEARRDEDAESYSTIAEWDGVLTKDDREGYLFSVRIQEMYLRPNLRWVVDWTDDRGDTSLISERGPIGEAFP